MKAANLYLNLAGNTEEAFEFYRAAFGGSFAGLVRFRDFGQTEGMEEMSEDDLDRIAHIALPLGDSAMLMGTDVLDSGERSLTVGNNVHITLEAESREEAERLFNALSEGGRVEMPLQQTQWAERYGSFADRFGVQWMVNFTGDVQFSGGS